MEYRSNASKIVFLNSNSGFYIFIHEHSKPERGHKIEH